MLGTRRCAKQPLGHWAPQARAARRARGVAPGLRSGGRSPACSASSAITIPSPVDPALAPVDPPLDGGVQTLGRVENVLPYGSGPSLGSRASSSQQTHRRGTVWPSSAERSDDPEAVRSRWPRVCELDVRAMPPGGRLGPGTTFSRPGGWVRGFLCGSIVRSGNTVRPASIGCRSPSTASRRNSVNSSRKSTPWCASVRECTLDRTNQGTPGRRSASTTGSGACHTASTLFRCKSLTNFLLPKHRQAPSTTCGKREKPRSD
jgi:hypothetical protein